MTLFVGRKRELEKLKSLEQTKTPKLVVIKGRRRIGKSRLAEEFAKDKNFISLSGLSPLDNISSQDQRDTFAQQISQKFNIPPFTFKDWSDGFAHLAQHLTKEPTVVLLDEISWMGSKDPTFIPKLKLWWDLTLKDYPNLILIFCGSVSTWIEENIINSTAFFGRITLQIDLEELSVKESYALLGEIGIKASHYDIFKLLSIIGGVPWYLLQINPQETVDENIRRLCFEKGGLLVNEFDRIFHDLFDRSGDLYKKILHILSTGMKDLKEIRQALDYTKSGYLSHHMKKLTTSGFVTQHYKWSLKSKSMSRQSLYRLSDNYIRFFLKYIEPNFPKIRQNVFKELSINNLPGWESMMGYQVENLILKNRYLLLRSLGIEIQDIVADNPYIQKSTVRQKGCQIDYLIQTHTNNLYVCEFKFKKKEITSQIVEEVENKVKRFPIPKGYGICPVLVHLGGVNDTVYENNYFYRIIDIEDFLS